MFLLYFRSGFSTKNLNFSFLGQLFQYCLLGLKACRLRFASPYEDDFDGSSRDTIIKGTNDDYDGKGLDLVEKVPLMM